MANQGLLQELDALQSSYAPVAPQNPAMSAPAATPAPAMAQGTPLNQTLTAATLAFPEILKMSQAKLGPYTDLLQSIAMRSVPAATGASIGGAIGNVPGAVIGGAIGAIGGNLWEQNVRQSEGRPLSSTEAATNIGLDLAFSALPAAGGAISAFKPTIQHTKEAIQKLEAFKRLNIPVHPFQVLGDRAKSLFQGGEKADDIYKGLSDFVFQQKQSIEKASQGAFKKLGLTEITPKEFDALTSAVGKNIQGQFGKVNQAYDDALKLFGNARASGQGLIDELGTLAKTLKSTNPDDAAAVTRIIPRVKEMISKTNTVTGKNIKNIRTFLNTSLKEELMSAKTGQISQNYATVRNSINQAVDSVENALAMTAAKTNKLARKAPIALKKAREQYGKLQELIKSVGGSDLQKAIRETGRDTIEFGESLVKNPQELTDIFFKSKNPINKLKQIIQLGGKEAKELVKRQFPTRILKKSTDVIDNTSSIQKATKNLADYKTQSDLLFGKKSVQQFTNQARDIDLIESVAKESPDVFAANTTKALDPNAVGDTLEELRNVSLSRGLPMRLGSAAGGAALGGVVGGPTGAALGGAAGGLFGQPLITGTQRIMRSKFLSPLGMTKAEEILKIPATQNIFDLGPSALVGATGGVSLEEFLKSRLGI